MSRNKLHATIVDSEVAANDATPSSDREHESAPPMVVAVVEPLITDFLSASSSRMRALALVLVDSKALNRTTSYRPSKLMIKTQISAPTLTVLAWLLSVTLDSILANSVGSPK